MNIRLCGLMCCLVVVLFKQKPAYGMRISDWSSDVCSSDLIHTPWGSAVNYGARPVREFVIENALYWLREYRFDGLRFGAVDQIQDFGGEHLLEEMARTVRSRIAADEPGRHIHLVLRSEEHTS